VGVNADGNCGNAELQLTSSLNGLDRRGRWSGCAVQTNNDLAGLDVWHLGGLQWVGCICAVLVLLSETPQLGKHIRLVNVFTVHGCRLDVVVTPPSTASSV
jgi:hypothetical protein